MSEPASTFVAALGWALVNFLWQGLAIGLAAAAALMLLRNARPQTRYAVACIALALCVALPALGLIRGLQAETSASIPVSFAATAANAANVGVFVVPIDSWRTLLQVRLPWIVSLWSLGAALLALRMALGVAWVGRMRRANANAVDPRWQAKLDHLAVRFGLHRPVPLRVAAELDSPVAAGWWRPMVLVPAALIARMPPDLLEALLAHELAHVKRYDYLVNLVQSAIEALLFYHPVVWWLSKLIRAERECIADELAAQALGEPKRLALALQELDLIRANDGFTQPHLAPAAHGGNLMSRIQRLVRPDRHALSWKVALPILGLSAVCLTVFAHGQAPADLAVATVAPATLAVVSAEDNVATPDDKDRLRDAYAVIYEGRRGMTLSGNVNDIRDADKARRSVQGDFLWFRRGDKSYVVQDSATLAKIDEAWKASRTLGAQMEALGDEMKGYSKVMDDLGQQMKALNAKAQPNAEMERAGAEMKAVSQQQQALSEKMQMVSAEMSRANSDREREALNAKMQALDAQMRPFSDRMKALGETMNAHSAQMQQSQPQMDELSRRMNEAGKPMEALGKQMDVLGKQQEKLNREADREVHALIDDALANGKAVPMSKLD